VPCVPIISADPSRLTGNDEWAWGIARLYIPDECQLYQRLHDVSFAIGQISGERRRLAGVPDDLKPFILVVEEIDGVSRRCELGIPMGNVKADARRHGAHLMVCDQMETTGIKAELKGSALKLKEYSWGNPDKISCVTELRQLMLAGQLCLPDDPILVEQLKTYAEIITSTGTIKYRARGSYHDDRVSVVMGAVRALQHNWLPKEPRGGLESDRMAWRDIMDRLPYVGHGMSF
jgi:hypothetical protein